MSNVQPKVSIVVPCYNVEKYIRQCLDSIINQTLKEIEIICVNDGSKDSTLEILNEYKSKDDRVKIIDKKNSGYGDSMNKGMELAEGEYIGIVESDDYILDNMFERLYKTAIKQEAEIVKSNYYHMTSGIVETTHVVKLDPENKHYNRIINPSIEPEVFKFPMFTWSGIYKRSFLNKNNIKHNTTPAASFQDNGFFFQTFSKAKRVYFIDETFYKYRNDNPESSINRNSVANIEKSQKEYEFIRNFINNNPDLNKNIIYAYNWQKLQIYLSWYDKESEEKWIEIAHKEFRESYNKKEINFDFYSPERQKLLKTIIFRPGLFDGIMNKIKSDAKKLSPAEYIFSVKNMEDHKQLCLLGVKLKFRKK